MFYASWCAGYNCNPEVGLNNTYYFHLQINIRDAKYLQVTGKEFCKHNKTKTNKQAN